MGSVSKGQAAAWIKQCERGPKSCGDVAYLYQHGDHVPKDDCKASHFYRVACDAGNASSCYIVAHRQRDGACGIPKDVNKWLRAMTDFCDRGLARACGALANAYQSQTWGYVKQDLVLAEKYRSKECTIGYGDSTYTGIACEELREMKKQTLAKKYCTNSPLKPRIARRYKEAIATAARVPVDSVRIDRVELGSQETGIYTCMATFYHAAGALEVRVGFNEVGEVIPY